MSRIARHLARWCRAAARWLMRVGARLDPKPVGDDMAQAEHMITLIGHAKAGRIRKRRGESDRAFAGRLLRGDFHLYSNLIDLNIERKKRMLRALEKGNAVR